MVVNQSMLVGAHVFDSGICDQVASPCQVDASHVHHHTLFYIL